MAEAVPEEPEGDPRRALEPEAVGPGLQPPTLNAADIAAGIGPEHAAEVAAALEAVERRQADQQLVELLATHNFSGAAYDAFANDLARYGVSVMRAWIASGYVFALLRRKGIGGEFSDRERTEIRRRTSLVDDLSHMTVARALSKFRLDALVLRGWDADRGASLTTYFMGRCLFEFSAELKSHRLREAKWARDRPLEDITDEREMYSDGDPARVVGNADDEMDRLRSMSRREASIVLLASMGYEQEEIVELLSESSVRAVEAVLYRLRTNMKGKDSR